MKQERKKRTNFLKIYLRYNDYKHDPLAKCSKCKPPYSAENAISSRCDLNPKNGTYPFGALGHREHGGTDSKVCKNRNDVSSRMHVYFAHRLFLNCIVNIYELRTKYL